MKEKNAIGESTCEAGCYQCLLSYFNQPDHENIDRRNQDALKILLGLTHATVIATESTSNVEQRPTTESSLIQQWLAALQQANLKQPDATEVTINQGQAIAAGQYKAQRILVFVEAINDELINQLQDKGWQLLDFSVPEQWSSLFAQYADLIGKK